MLLIVLLIVHVLADPECENALVAASTADDVMMESHIKDVYTHRDIQLNKLAHEQGQNWIFSHSDGSMKVGYDLSLTGPNHPNSKVCEAKGVVHRKNSDGSKTTGYCPPSLKYLGTTSTFECSPSHWTHPTYGPSPTLEGDWHCGSEEFRYAYGVLVSDMSAFPGPPLTVTDRHTYTQYHEAVRGTVLDSEMAYERSSFFGDNDLSEMREITELMNEHNIAMEQLISGVRMPNGTERVLHAKYVTLHPHMSRTTHHRSSRYRDWVASRFTDPSLVHDGSHYLKIQTPKKNYTIPLIHDMASDDLAGYVWCNGGFCSVGDSQDVEHVPSYTYWNQTVTFFESNASLYSDKIVPQVSASYTTSGKRAHEILKLLIALSYLRQKTTISRLAGKDDVGRIAYYYAPIADANHQLLMLPVLGKLIRYNGPNEAIGYTIQVSKRVFLNFHASFGLSWSLEPLHYSCNNARSFSLSDHGQPISEILPFNEIGKLDDGSYVFWRHTVPSKMFPFYYLMSNPKVLQHYRDEGFMLTPFLELYANHSGIHSDFAHLAHYGVKQSAVEVRETLFVCSSGVCTFMGSSNEYASGRAVTTDTANFLYVLLGVGLTLFCWIIFHFRKQIFGLCFKAAQKVVAKGQEQPVVTSAVVAASQFEGGLACSEMSLLHSRTYCTLQNCSNHLLLNCTACNNFPYEIGSCLLQFGFKHEIFNFLFVIFCVMICVMVLWGHNKWTHFLFGLAMIITYFSLPKMPLFDVFLPHCVDVSHLSSVSHCTLKACDNSYVSQCSPCRALPTEIVRCITGHLFGEEFYSFLALLFVVSLFLTIAVPRNITLGWVPYGMLILTLNCFMPKAAGVDLQKKDDIKHMFDNLAFPYATYFNTNTSSTKDGKMTSQIDSIIKHAFGPHIGVKVRLAPSLEITYYGQAFYGGPCQFQAYCDGGDCLLDKVYICDHFCPGESQPSCPNPSAYITPRPGWVNGNGFPMVHASVSGSAVHMFRCMKTSFSSTGACFLCCSSGVKTINVGIERLATCKYLEHCLTQDLNVEMDFYLKWDEAGVISYYYGVGDVSAAQSFCVNKICIQIANYEKDVGTRNYLMLLPYGNDTYVNAWQLPASPKDFGYCDTQFANTDWKSTNFTSKLFETYDLPVPSSNDGGCFSKRSIPDIAALSKFPEIKVANVSIIGSRGFRKVRRELLLPRILDSWIQGSYVSSYTLGVPCLSSLSSGKTYEAIRGSGHSTILSLKYENTGDPGLGMIIIKNTKVLVEPATIVLFKGSHNLELNLYPQDATTQGSLCIKTCSEKCTPLEFKATHPTGTIIPPGLAMSMVNTYDSTWQNAIGAVTGFWSSLTSIFGNIGTYFMIAGIIILILVLLALGIYCYRVRKMKKT